MSTPAPWGGLCAVVAMVAVLVWPGAGPAPEAPAGAAAPTTGAVRARGRVLARWRRALGRDPGGDEVLGVLDALAAALEAGLPVSRAVALAVGSLGPTAAEHWAELGRRAEAADPLGPAWAAAARRTGDPALAGVARAWAVGEASGAPLADAVRAGGAAARESRRLSRAIDVATAGARATATVLMLLPLAGVGLAAVMGVPPSQLYGSWASRASALVGLTLLGVGHLVVGRLVAAVTRGLP